MGLLDELKRKADKIRSDDEANLSVEAKKQAYYEKKIRPTLDALVKFLQELLEQLKVVNPQVYGHFDVPGMPKPGIKALQTLPTLNLDSTVNTKIVLLRFVSEASNLEFAVRPAQEAEETRKFLTKLGQQFSDWPIRAADGAIEGLRFAIAKITIPGFLRFEADIDHSCIVLKSTDARGFGYKEERLKVDDITNDWLDHFGRFLLGEAESPVNKYNGHIDRRRFQKLVDQDRQRREQELAAAEQEQREKEEAARLSSRINRAFNNVKQRLPKINSDETS